MLKELIKQIAPEFGYIAENAEVESQIEKEVISKLDRSVKLDEVDTITFGLETDDKKIVKVYVKVEDAEEFEKELGNILGKFDDIEEALNELSKKFEIVDVDWPDDAGEDPEAEAEQDGSEVLDPKVYKNAKDRKDMESELEPKMETLNFGELATMGLMEDANSIEGRLNTAQQLLIYHAILELGIPEVALARNPYRTAIIKGIRDKAFELSKNAAMKQALKMFVKKSVDADDRPANIEKDGKAPVKEAVEDATESLIGEFWDAFRTLVKYIAPDPATAKALLGHSRMKLLVSRSSSAITTRVSTRLRQRLREMTDAIKELDGVKKEPTEVTESASVDEVASLLIGLLNLADASKNFSQTQAVADTATYRQMLAKVKVDLTQKFSGRLRTRLNHLQKALAKALEDAELDAVEPVQKAKKKLDEAVQDWSFEKNDDVLSISNGFLKMDLEAEETEKLVKAIANRDAVVVKDVEGKKFVFSPRGVNVKVKPVGSAHASHDMSSRDVDDMVKAADLQPKKDEKAAADKGERPDSDFI